jgi:hypothetical protein
MRWLWPAGYATGHRIVGSTESASQCPMFHAVGCPPTRGDLHFHPAPALRAIARRLQRQPTPTCLVTYLGHHLATVSAVDTGLSHGVEVTALRSWR